MKPKVYIDGKEGTTGLQIYDRLASRDDIDLLLIDEAKLPRHTAPRLAGYMEFRSFPLRIKMQSFTRILPQIRAVTHRDS